MNSLATIIYSFITTLAMCYFMHDILSKKDFNLKKLIIPYIIVSLITSVGCLYLNKTVKIIILGVTFFLYVKFVYGENIKKSILTSIFYQLCLMIAELLFCIIVIMILNKDIDKLMNNPIYSILINIIISAINILIIKIPFIKKFFNYLIKITNKLNAVIMMIFSMAVILIANILTTVLYYRVDFIYLLIFNTLVILFCFFITIYNFVTQNKYINVFNKYNTTLNSLRESEDIIDKYRVSNHENKNQLLTIRNMLLDKNNDTVKYIDQLIKNKEKDNESVMKEVSKIPSGGLRGLIYSKLLFMKQNKIKYDLNISKDIRTVDLIKDLKESDILDICQIIGVYIDNAIDAVLELKKKYIDIELYLDNKNLVFEVSNYYKGFIDLDKLEEKGYTTKSNGRGYGLSLAKNIVDNNKKLKNEKKLSGEVFTQILKIKLK